jgi:hypothetical protein
MLRRVQCTFPRTNWLVVVPAAIALASCGGSIGGDSVTGVSVDEIAAEAALAESLDADDPADEDGTLSADHRKKKKAKEKKKNKNKVLLCHKGRDKWVHKRAVKAHLRHGDTLGACGIAPPPPPPATCPCFSVGDIQAAAGTCGTSVAATCSTGDPYYLVMSCDPGGSVPPGVLGIYLTQTPNGGMCSRDDVFGSVSQDGLSDAEYQACVNAINGSGYCS